jgi:hypothetical protein
MLVITAEIIVCSGQVPAWVQGVNASMAHYLLVASWGEVFSDGYVFVLH